MNISGGGSVAGWRAMASYCPLGEGPYGEPVGGQTDR